MIHFHLQRPFKMRHAFLAIIAVLGLTKRDLEKSGLMARASGCWNDKQIIRDQDYLSDLLTDSQKSNRAYGYLRSPDQTMEFRREVGRA